MNDKPHIGVDMGSGPSFSPEMGVNPGSRVPAGALLNPLRSSCEPCDPGPSQKEKSKRRQASSSRKVNRPKKRKHLPKDWADRLAKSKAPKKPRRRVPTPPLESGENRADLKVKYCKGKPPKYVK